MTQERQGKFPLIETVEYVKNLHTGEERLRRRKVRQRRRPTLAERERAIRDWLTETAFEKKFQFGAEAWHAAESVKSAEMSGQMVEYFSGRGAGDDAEIALRDTLDIARTRFLPVRSFDIAKIIRRQIFLTEDKLRLHGTWIHLYADWVIDLMKTSRNLSETTTEALKKYVHQGVLLEES